jgi:uncharacterized protein YndB with AHSA1/START domain
MTKESTTFVYAAYIRATPEKLWAALTKGECSEKYWFGFRVESDWKEGSSLRVRAPDEMKKYGDIVGKVLYSEPPRRLSYTFASSVDARAAKRRGPTRVTCELSPMGPVVKLRLAHENLLDEDVSEDPNDFEGVNNGWPAIISSLKSLLETGEAITFKI